MRIWPFPSTTRRQIRVALGAALAVASVATAPFWEPERAEAAAPPTTGPTPGGALVICGGGPLVESVRDRFLELAGGANARIVVIPTAHAFADTPRAVAALEPWAGRVASVRLLHTRSRDQADDPEFARPLAEATGVWLGGGQQAALTSAYLGTAVERRLNELLARGGVIGGSSAGASAMTRVMIAGGRRRAIEGRGFDFLPGAVVDQHFLKRDRVARLVGFLGEHPGLVGFGIDEQTALVVRGRHLDVVGESFVVVCSPGSGGRPGRIGLIGPGDRADLDTWAAVTPPAGPGEVIVAAPDDRPTGGSSAR